MAECICLYLLRFKINPQMSNPLDFGRISPRIDIRKIPSTGLVEGTEKLYIFVMHSSKFGFLPLDQGFYKAV